MDVREEILTLRRQLEHANFLYYVKDAPEISDFEYDALMRRLEELEAAHPEYASPDSPTQHVGGYALNTFAQVRHQVPLESLQDVFSFDELRAFGARMDGALTQTHDYSVEPKIDGLSILLLIISWIMIFRRSFTVSPRTSAYSLGISLSVIILPRIASSIS